MRIGEIVSVLDAVAPPDLAEDWDNVGLLVGDAAGEADRLMVCVDLTSDVLASAVRAKAQMVVTHHSVIFRPLSRLTRRDTPIVHEAVRNNVSVYCMHTNFDAAPGGTNDVLAAALGLRDPRPLERSETGGRCKVTALLPPNELPCAGEAAIAAGAERLEAGEESRLEMIVPRSGAAGVCEAIRAACKRETPAIEVCPLTDYPPDSGLGRIGGICPPATVEALVARIGRAMGLKTVQLAGAGKGRKRVSIAACAAGSCGTQYRLARAEGATFYVTGEMKHHEAIEAVEAGLSVAVLGHGNSERLAMKRLAGRLRKMLPDVSVVFAKRDRDPLVTTLCS